jgi:hypothetical protein
MGTLAAVSSCRKPRHYLATKDPTFLPQVIQLLIGRGFYA